MTRRSFSADTQTERARRRRSRLLAAGLCTRCAAPRDRSTERCLACTRRRSIGRWSCGCCGGRGHSIRTCQDPRNDYAAP